MKTIREHAGPLATISRRQLMKLGGAGALLTSFGVARAQGEWPQRPLRLVVPVAPGGVYDAQARLEVAFVIREDLPAEVPSWGEFLRAVDHALPAIEIVDSAIEGWRITLADTVADNASSALYVLGDQPVSVGRLQLAELNMAMRCAGNVVSEGKGAACLGHPLRAAWWLARTMASEGQPLRAGEVIMSGALGPMVPVKRGDVVVADLSALGTVSCRLA